MGFGKWALFAILFAIGVSALYLLGFLGDTTTTREALNIWLQANQGLVLFIGLAVLAGLFYFFTRGGRKALQTDIPVPSWMPWWEARETLENEDNEYADLYGAAQDELYNTPDDLLVDAAEGKGVHLLIADAKGSYVPPGMSKNMVFAFNASIVPSPFSNKSRLMSVYGLDRGMLLHNAKKAGDLAYELLGVSDNKHLYSEIVRDHPELLPQIPIDAKTAESFKK